MKITFKKEPRETGLGSVGSGWYTTLKIKKKQFGYIKGGGAFSKGISIGFMFKDEKDSGGWKWGYLKHTATNEAEAREAILIFFTNNPEKLNDIYLQD